MKKILTGAVLGAMLLTFSMSANAMMPRPMDRGEGPNPEKMIEMMEKREAKMAEELGLTKEQTEKAEKVRKEGREKMKPLMDEMKTVHEKMDKLRKENMDEFEKILTKEQKEKFEKIKAERPERMHAKKGMHKGGKGMKCAKDCGMKDGKDCTCEKCAMKDGKPCDCKGCGKKGKSHEGHDGMRANMGGDGKVKQEILMKK